MGNWKRFIPYRLHSLSKGSSTGKSFQEKWGLDKKSIGQEPKVNFKPFATTTPQHQRSTAGSSVTSTRGSVPTTTGSDVRSTWPMRRDRPRVESFSSSKPVGYPGVPKTPRPSGTFHMTQRSKIPTAGILDYSQYENPPITRATKTERAIAGVSFYGDSNSRTVRTHHPGYPKPHAASVLAGIYRRGGVGLPPKRLGSSSKPTVITKKQYQGGTYGGRP